MSLSRCVLLAALAIITLTSSRFGFEQAISGSAKVKLCGSITPEQISECKQDARARFRLQLLRWLEQERGIRVDTTDVLANLLFNNFIDSCLNHAVEIPAFKEQYWTFSYSIMTNALKNALSSYNDRIELLSVHSWERLTNAVAQGDNDRIYFESINAIAGAAQYLGPPLVTPRDSMKLIVIEARKILRNFLARLSISQTGQLIEGSPGHVSSSPPSINVMIDGKPFAGFGLTGIVSNGQAVWNGVADNNGLVSLDNLVTPFVKNGSTLHVVPNLGRVLDSKWRLGIADFGVGSTTELNRVFFLKVHKPRYLLSFEAARAGGQADSIPQEFISGALIRSYLTDSCWLEPAVDNATADLAIIIRCHISTAEDVKTDGSVATFTGNVSINAPQFSPPREEKDSIFFEKTYKRVAGNSVTGKSGKTPERITVPLGNFLWESNIRLRTAIRRILDRM